MPTFRAKSWCTLKFTEARGKIWAQVLEVADTFNPIEDIELLIISDREHRRMLEVLSGGWPCTLSVDLRIAVQVADPEGAQSSGFKLNALLQYLSFTCLHFDIWYLIFDIWYLKNTAMQAWK